jgi:23S rRNA pseudouridine1911/1915/1917 synthase
MANIKTPQGNIEIIFDDDDILVINKPAGLIVHEAESHDEKTLADYLLSVYPQLAGVGEEDNRPGIVHRLDKDASGLMVVAKNNTAFKHLKAQFKTRRVKKEYIALAYGKLSKDEGEIIFPIIRAKSGHKMAALPVKVRSDKEKLSNRDQGNLDARGKAREASTKFIVEKRWPHFTLLQVKIKTGRTHQIRVHLAAYGHPLLGDNLYGTPKTKVKNKKISLGRIFLMAQKLSFRDLKGEKREFQIELDPILQEFLKKLK